MFANKLIAGIAATLGVTLCVATAVHAAGSTVVRVPVSFDLTTGDCPQLAANVHGQGEEQFVSHVSNSKVKIQSAATGTAVDSDGNHYQFSYINHETDFAPQAFPFVVHVRDRFALEGKGKAANLKLSFNVVLQILDDSGDFIILSGSIPANITCDPI